MNITKLTKVQREMLQSAVDSEAQYGVRKPITSCPLSWRARVEADEFTVCWTRYVKQMLKLEDAGLVKRSHEYDSCYVYIKSIAVARKALKELA